MSQILIISDSHYLRKNELNKFFKQFANIHHIIHCGDIYIGYKPSDFENLYICRGNNDFVDIPRFLHFEIDGVRFIITHGHLNNYAYHPLSLKELLDEYPSDVICFGHTHVPYCHKEDHLIIINPGSLSLGRNYPRINTYAILDTETLETHFYNVKTHEEIFVNNQ